MGNLTVEQLIQWRARILGTTDINGIVHGLSREGLARKDEPEGAGAAIRNFRHLSMEAKRRRVERALSGMAPGSSPLAAIPHCYEAPEKQAPESPSGKPEMELVSDKGETFVTLRSFKQVFGKRAEHLPRVLEGRGLPIKRLLVRNKRGERRPTPCIHTDHALSVVAGADTRGMNHQQKAIVSTVQVELRTLMARYEATAKPPTQIVKAMSNEMGLLKPIEAVIEKATHAIVSAIDATMGRFLPALVSAVEIAIDSRLARLEKVLPPSLPAKATVRGHLTDGTHKSDFRGHGHTITALHGKLGVHLQHKKVPTVHDLEVYLRENGMADSPWSQFDPKRGDTYDDDTLDEVCRHFRPNGLGREVAFDPAGVDPMDILDTV